jgi:iron-sulfur cluster repair protein YtfE (RIC family)
MLEYFRGRTDKSSWSTVTALPSCTQPATVWRSGEADLESDTHLHLHPENNVLLPAVARLQD